jgi:hypothetical protein
VLIAEIKLRHSSGFGRPLFGASTVPRYCPRFLMIETRQLRSLAAEVLYGRFVTVREICRMLPELLPNRFFAPLFNRFVFG